MSLPCQNMFLPLAAISRPSSLWIYFCVELLQLQSSSEFTEEFDFVAMNEKFNKDEVWGYLGKAKQTAKKMEGVDIALVNEDKGNEVDHGLDSNADPKVGVKHFQHV